jgi:hypothetical protein
LNDAGSIRNKSPHRRCATIREKRGSGADFIWWLWTLGDCVRSYPGHPAVVTMQESRRRPINFDEEKKHLTQGALRLLEQALPRRPEMQWVVVPGPWDGLDLAQTVCVPGRRNELPPVLWELAGPVRRMSVTQAFPDAVVVAAPGLEQFGLQLPKR